LESQNGALDTGNVALEPKKRLSCLKNKHLDPFKGNFGPYKMAVGEKRQVGTPLTKISALRRGL